MKLAEALILRADLKTRAAQLRERLKANAKVQEGESPAEDPAELLREFEEVAAQTLVLIQQINRTNAQTPFDGGEETLSDALARRDVLKLRLAAYRELKAAAVEASPRFARLEIKSFAAINVGATQKQADDLARDLRELDTRVQGLNWMIDLVQ